MSGDPFSGLTDTFQDRKRRGGRARARKQKWVAFWASLGATVLVAVSTGAGGACGGWAVERAPANVLDRLAGGAVCGLAGGAFLFLAALWRTTRRTVVNDALGIEEDVDVGATLFWAAVAGAALFGSLGASRGLAGKGAFAPGVLGCAVAAALLALVPAGLLRGAARRKTRTGSGPAAFRNPVPGTDPAKGDGVPPAAK
ncbi:MAG: hypothetical protein J0I06_15955 [Planctomycetes bacterium]|nr:hypothetical protein [Planctomycetota bacterium]